MPNAATEVLFPNPEADEGPMLVGAIVHICQSTLHLTLLDIVLEALYFLS